MPTNGLDLLTLLAEYDELARTLADTADPRDARSTLERIREIVSIVTWTIGANFGVEIAAYRGQLADLYVWREVLRHNPLMVARIDHLISTLEIQNA